MLAKLTSAPRWLMLHQHARLIPVELYMSDKI
ncbi:thioredoxin, partial [Salmonella enterica subsp. enterica serovar Agama]|nr:thioredoxin [Salmonella enterica subsp. enterica serovar Agama]